MVAAQQAAPLATCVLLVRSVLGVGLQGRPVRHVLLAQHLRQGPPAQTNATQSWRHLTADYFTLSSSDKWTNLTLNATAGVTCLSLMEACRNSSTCIQMRVANDYTSCQMYSSNPSGSTTFSYKVGQGMDYVRYKITGADLANVIATPAASTLTACEFACSASQNCEGVMFTASTSSCRMVASELDGEYMGVVHVWPYNLVSYLVRSVTVCVMWCRPAAISRGVCAHCRMPSKHRVQLWQSLGC